MTDERLAMLQSEREHSEHMVGLFVALLRELDPRLVSAAFEWPQGAMPWKRPFKALEELMTLLPVSLEFDGCMYGFVSKKPWRVQTNAVVLQTVLDRHCDQAISQHPHVACRGVVARDSETYTDELAEVIAEAVTNAGGSLVAPLDAAEADPKTGAASSSSGLPLD